MTSPSPVPGPAPDRRPDPLLARLLPAEVACAELFADPPGLSGYPAEEVAIAHAVESRRREYRAVRHCARIALAELGVAAAAIGSGARREPLWPSGVVGSLTHCAGYRGAALARSDEVRAVGIDAEPHRALPTDVLGVVTRPEERRWLAELAGAHPSTHWDRLLFCAKEAVYKAWFPLTAAWLGFEEASVRLDPSTRRFTVRLREPAALREGPIEGAPSGFDGRWTVADGLVLTAVLVPVTGSGS